MQLLLILLILVSSTAYAKDNGQYADTNPQIKEWIEKLENKDKVNCCNSADGYDVQWDTKDNKYIVFLYDKWWVVPDEAVLDHIPNLIKVPRVWYMTTWNEGVPTPKIRCFLPGART